ncbi:MAG: hypothetical protein ACOCSN_05185 [Halanaeroarchaeum sp.]
MGKRVDALWWIWAFIWVNTFGYLLALVVVTVGFVWGLVDVLWQLIVGTDGLSASSTPAGWVQSSLTWLVEQEIYAFTGANDFAWLPSF